MRISLIPFVFVSLLLVFSACKLETPSESFIAYKEPPITTSTPVVAPLELPNDELDTTSLPAIEIPEELLESTVDEWCPVGTSEEDEAGFLRTYVSVTEQSIHDTKVEACEVHGSLEGEHSFTFYLAENGDYGKMIMYEDETIISITEQWRENGLQCSQEIDASGEPIDEPECLEI